MTTDLNSIQGAPLANCFYFLPSQEIGTMCLVSRGWMNAASIQELWNCILENEFHTTIPLKIGETKALYKRIGFLPKELIDALGGIQNYLELPKNEVPNATSLSKWEFTNDDGSLRQLQLTVPFETRVNDMIDKNFLIIDISPKKQAEALPIVLFRLHKKNDAVTNTLKAYPSVPKDSGKEEDRAVQEKVIGIFQALQIGELDLSRIFD